MHILIDSADIQAIRSALATGFVSGVTTNPTLLRRAGVRASQVAELAAQVFAAGAQELHLQTYATDTAGMLREAKELLALDADRIAIKLLATPDGYRAAAQLSAMGVRVTLTAVYTLRQALLAQNVGAHYIAIYLGRMRDAGIDSLALAGQMQAMLNAQQSPVGILAASIRDPEEVSVLGAQGIAAATIAPAVLEQLLASEATNTAAATFSADALAIQTDTPL